MKPVFVIAGAFLLVLGGALSARVGLYKAEAQMVSQESTGGVNSNSTATYFSSVAGLADLSEAVSLVGVVLAPIGGAILAYGLSTSKGSEPVQQGPSSVPQQT